MGIQQTLRQKKSPSANYTRDNQTSNIANSISMSDGLGASVNLARNSTPCQSQNTQFGLVGISQFTQEQYYTQILQILGKGNKNGGSFVVAGMENAVTTTSENLIKWIVDSGASNHMVKNIQLLTESSLCDKSREGNVYLPTGNLVIINHISSTYLFPSQKITNVMHIPEF